MSYSKAKLARRNAGLCVDCGAPATRGVRCEAHAARAKATARAWMLRTYPSAQPCPALCHPKTCGNCGKTGHNRRTCREEAA